MQKFTRRTFLQQFSAGAAATVLFPEALFAQDFRKKSLPRSSPEAQGIASNAILSFLEAAAKNNHEFHSFMLVRHGYVVAEGWWQPYQADVGQLLYSLSKSFTSTAIGFAVTEGRLSVGDKVVSFFPKELPAKVSENLASMRVKDLLTMSVGHDHDTTWDLLGETDWMKKFLAVPTVHQPGSKFLYDSAATYMLSAILQKLTGKTVLEYLKPRLFKPLGIEGGEWETDPKGINLGGWGLRLKTEDLAKFGQLYLQKGNWRGKQILPESWVAEATSFKIDNHNPDWAPNKERSDWSQGYCYQFWRCRHNAYRGDGAFGQYCLVMPEQDAVVIITSETKDLQGELDLVYEHLLPAMKTQPLPADTSAQAALKNYFQHAEIQPLARLLLSPVAEKISDKSFQVAANSLNVQSVSFTFQPGECLFNLKDDKGDHRIVCGFGKWVTGKTDMPGTPPQLFPLAHNRPSAVAGSAAWLDEQTLQMRWQYFDTPNHDLVTCRFDDKGVQVEFMNSITAMIPDLKERRPLLKSLN